MVTEATCQDSSATLNTQLSTFADSSFCLHRCPLRADSSSRSFSGGVVKRFSADSELYSLPSLDEFNRSLTP